MHSRALREEIKSRLLAPQASGGRDLFGGLPPKKAVRALIGLLPSQDELLKWRAVQAMGHVVKALCADGPEPGREVLRRLAWSLNDESGGIGWGAPEAMAEIMHRDQTLAAEFGNLLVSYINPCGNYLEHEPLRVGAIWGLGRLAATQAESLCSCGADGFLTRFLQSEDPASRGLTAWALGELNIKGARDDLRGLTSDQNKLSIWLHRELIKTTVGHLAKEAMAKLASGPTPA